MTDVLHLTITTPAQILIDAGNVVAVRTDDQSGSFGVLPGHTDMLTVLLPSVVRWRGADGTTGFCAVRGGVFAVSKGRQVAIACREGVVGASLESLEQKVHVARAQQIEDERKIRAEQTRLHALAVRQLVKYLRPGPTVSTRSETAP